MLELRERVLRFWFIGPAAPATVGLREALKHEPLLRAPAWFSKSEEFDAAVREEFGTAIELVKTGAFKEWKRTAEGALALILLTDQFPRNAFRGEPKSFEFDSIALETCLQGLALRFDQTLHPVQRWFFYMPLEHSENPACQERAVGLFGKLVDDAGPELRQTLEGALDFARRHREVIGRFGRFPHRNGVLRRASTASEIEFLRGPGSRF